MTAPDGNSGKERNRRGAFPSRSVRDLTLTRLLRAQEVATTAQLQELGLTKREIEGLVGHGDLVRVHRGVYADGRTHITPRGRLRAALLTGGPTAFLSHRSAAGARGYRPINVHDIHVSVVAEHTPRVPGLSFHRTGEPGHGEVTAIGDLRAATLARILLELAPSARATELDELITAAERRNALGSVEAVLERHAGRPGITRLRAALAGHLSSPQGNSGLEAEVWAWYYGHPELPPPDETNYRLGPHEFDGYWRRQRLILEIDSRDYHQARADMERDRVKDIYVQKLGLRIVRITDFRFEHDRPGIYADLVAFLQRAA